MTQSIIQSYFRINNDFVRIDEFKGRLPDKHYIEGAIVCKIQEWEIFKKEHWDLVDQLWASIVEGLQKLENNPSYDAFFPDQPLRLEFEKISPQWIKISIGDEVFSVDGETFRSVLKRGAIEFFSRMKEVCPEATDTWERYQKVAQSLRG